MHVSTSLIKNMEILLQYCSFAKYCTLNGHFVTLKITDHTKTIILGMDHYFLRGGVGWGGFWQFSGA